MRRKVLRYKRIFALLAIVLILVSTFCSTVTSHAENADRKLVALTFDDGPHPGRTPEILDILKKYNIKATFFLIGQNIEYYPEIVQREVEEGHEIGNHTYSHQVLSSCDEKKLMLEIDEFETALSDVCNYTSTLLRPPCGAFKDSFTEITENEGYELVLWNIDTRDWEHKSVDNIVKIILENVKDGDIILMHDYISGNSPTPEALTFIIPALLNEGYEFVTVSELYNEKER